MKHKRLVQYTVDPTDKWAGICAALMGIGFFLQAIHYFAIQNFSDCSVGEVILCLILPLLSSGAWMLFLRLLPVHHGKIYGVLGALICLVLMLQGFYSGSVVRAVVGVIWYLAAGAALILVTFGYLPYKILIPPVFVLPVALRILIVLQAYVATEEYLKGMREYAGIAMLLSLACLGGILKTEK